MQRLVLVHGLGVSGRYFEALVRELPDFETVRPDLRRFATVEEQAEALRRVVGDGAPLIGNSFGCQVIAELAEREPRVVGRTIFIGPTVDRRHRSLLEQAGRILLDMTRERASLSALIVRDYLAANPLRVAKTARSALGDALERKVPALTGPLLVVRGARDPLCPQDWAEEVARRAPRGRLHVVPGAAHAVHDSHPAQLGALVRDFLEEPE
jgi:pimeloyl-ACP methyl ester carboxylesterase